MDYEMFIFKYSLNNKIDILFMLRAIKNIFEKVKTTLVQL